MTLVLNEIHMLEGLRKTFIVAAADRRISKSNGSYDSTRRKLFRIPYLNGAVSYFGLAAVYPSGERQYLSEWLPSFIRGQSSAGTLQSFAQYLTESLNNAVPSSVLKNHASGFHICGYDRNGWPDFWYVSNIGAMTGFQQTNLNGRYFAPESHFLERDASKVHGWDRSNPLSAKNGVQTYRNGDYRAHVAAWDLLDQIYGRLTQFPDFRIPSSTEEYARYVKFKFEFIAYLYKEWARQRIIARPIDVLVLQSPTA
jgi:hypothetical protein